MGAVSYDLVPVPRGAVEFPLALPVPPGFVADDPASWPHVEEGQLEYFDGKLLYMPPSADRRQDTTADVLTVLGLWRRAHRDFVVAGNEAGMILGGEARGADAAIWRRSALGRHEGKFRRVAPVLAVEVMGELEDESALRAKAAWYLRNGVELVWLVLPEARKVIVLTSAGESVLTAGQRVAPHPSLPGLEPDVDDFFTQLEDLG